MAAMQRRMTKMLVRYFPKLGALDNQNKDLVRRTFSSIILRILRTGVSFMFNIVIGRLLGTDLYGVYSQAYTVTRVATVVGRGGLDQAVLRFTAANASQKKWDAVAGIIRLSLVTATIVSIIVTIVVYAAAPFLSQFLFQDPRITEPMRWMALGILPWSWFFLYGQLLQGIEKIEDSIFVQTMGVSIVQIPLLLLLATTYGATGAAFTVFVGNTLMALLGYRLWRRYVPQIRGVKGEFDRQLLMRTSIPLFWTDLTTVLIGVSDNLMLGFFASSSAVGVYDQAKRISILVSAFLTATSYVAAPKFAAMYARGETDKLGSLARNSARLTTLLAVPFLLLFIFAPGWTMSLLGKGYEEGAFVLTLLGISQFVNAATGAVGYLLIMTGHEKDMRNITLVTSAIKVVLLIVLIPPFSYIGAAIATMTGDVLRNVWAFVAVYQRLNIITLPIPDGLARRLTGLRSTPPSTPTQS
ncbi:MAG TPA: flippase [Phototrophicaceae bacterium]|jgi:O-antigen/teichoic acid export membrane protein|nr:flippase [Phototrophicaceae bacterium]